ncbi:MAG: hypothetical protein GF411_14005 [Candidatus Lokiarchaeota archaeon]|nr:hypothetical protein [Candidatus Lokiarchaeota archaeon]
MSDRKSGGNGTYASSNMYEIPDAPPLFKKDEQQWSAKLRTLRNKTFKNKDQWEGYLERYLSIKSGKISEYQYQGDPSALAEYENFVCEFTERLSYICVKEAQKLVPQCRKGLQYGDLITEGTMAVHEAIHRHKFRDLVSTCSNPQMKCGTCGKVHQITNGQTICSQHGCDGKLKPICNHVTRKPEVSECPKCGHKMSTPAFSGFVRKLVRTRMWTFLDDNSNTIKKPTSKIELIYVANKGTSYNDDVAMNKLAKKVNIPVSELRSFMIPTASINNIENEESIQLADRSDNNKDSLDARRRKYITKAIQLATSGNDECDFDELNRNTKIYIANQLMNDYKDSNQGGSMYSLSSLAEIYGVTKQRINQLIKRVDKNLRNTRDPRVFGYLIKARLVGTEFDEFDEE